MNIPAPLVKTWIEILYSRRTYHHAEAQAVAEDRLYKYFDSVKQAEMHLYRVTHQ